MAYNFQGLLGEEDNSAVLKDFLQWVDPPSKAITNVKNSSPDGEVTCPKHGFKDGDHVRILGVQGMTRINNSDDNLATQGPYYTVKNFVPADPDKFKLDGVDTSNKDIFKAYTSGGTATPNFSAPQDGEAISYSYFWIKNLGTLGLRNPAITADSPFAMAFNKTGAGGRKVWYVAWNPGTADGLTVTFSDGTKLGPIKADDVASKSVSK